MDDNENQSQSDKPSKRKSLKWNSPEHDPEEFRLSLVEHLDELRKRIFYSLAIFVIFWLLAWIWFTPISTTLTNRGSEAINAVLKPMHKQYTEIFLHIADAFMVKFKISIYCAIIASFPFWVLQLWAFVAPGLKPEEQRPLKRLAPVSLLLFVTGAFFCWLILPAAFGWFADYLREFPDSALSQEVGTMAMFSLKSMLAFGIGFQLPLVVFILGALNLLSAKTLMKYWRHAAVAIFFISGAITPSNDIPTMLMMAVPLTILFMISAFAVKLVQKNKKPSDFLISPDEPDEEKESDD